MAETRFTDRLGAGNEPWWARLQWQVFLTHVVILFPLVAAVGWVLYVYIERQIREIIDEELAQAAQLCVVVLAPALEEGEPLLPIMERLSEQSGFRVTLIEADGRVVADSEMLGRVEAIENHLDRPEVRAALATGDGSEIRVSTTTGERYMYHALAEEVGGREVVFRVAIPYGEVDLRIRAARNAIGALLAIALAAGAVLSLTVARRTTRPIEALERVAIEMGRGRFDVPLPEDPHGELRTLTQTLGWLQTEVATKISEIDGERTLLLTMIEAMTEGVLVVARDGRILLINPTALALLGSDDVWSARRAEGRMLLEVTRNARVHALVDAALARGQAAREEIESRRGVRRMLGVSVAPLREGESVRGAVVALYDLTQLRQLERVRQDFVANVSHELRTPVAAIRGWSETLSDADLEMPDFVREQLRTILRHAERLGALVDDLLVLAQLESVGLEQAFEEFDLRSALDESVDSLREAARAKQMSVSVSVDEACATVRLERRSLDYVVRNLVENAIKYTPAGGTVEISADRDSAGGLVVRVRDNGVGIAESHLPRIFERFYRIDKGRSRDVGGTGLGLSIVRHYAEALGGTVSVDSEPGRGSTFEVRLPPEVWRVAVETEGSNGTA